MSLISKKKETEIEALEKEYETIKVKCPECDKQILIIVVKEVVVKEVPVPAAGPFLPAPSPEPRPWVGPRVNPYPWGEPASPFPPSDDPTRPGWIRDETTIGGATITSTGSTSGRYFTTDGQGNIIPLVEEE